jgi:HupH hydrogenase expression protein, C-terminal conserved region
MRGEAIAPADFSTGMAKSLMREVARHLDALAKSGETAAIDLRSLPMTETDREELEEELGRGDVAVALDVAGRSEIWETGYAGVWWVRHYGGDDRVAAERIEITTVPDIIVTHRADIEAAAARLRDDLLLDA